MTGRLKKSNTAGLAGLAAAIALLAGLFAQPALAQQLECPDGEYWDIDKGALKKVVDSLPQYLNKAEPILLNMQALGAQSGELLVAFSRTNLQCVANSYRDQLDGSGTVSVCKRPNC